MIFVAEDFRRFISPCLTPAAMTQRLSSRKFFPFQNGNGPIVQIIFVLRMVPPGTVEVLPFLLRNWNKKFTLVCKVKYFPLFFIVYKKSGYNKAFSFLWKFLHELSRQTHPSCISYPHLFSYSHQLPYHFKYHSAKRRNGTNRTGTGAVAATSPI